MLASVIICDTDSNILTENIAELGSMPGSIHSFSVRVLSVLLT